MTASPNFQHQFLIAMPSLDDTWFEKTVIYMVEDNEKGSMGLTLNVPHHLPIEKLLEHFHTDIDPSLPYLSKDVLIGGPVDMEHGFILHTKTQTKWKKTIDLEGQLQMTVSEDMVTALGNGTGPEQFIVCLGFASWEKGQLAQEMQENSWLTIPYNASLLFDIPYFDKWRVALGTLGVSPEFLSLEAGHA